VKLALKNNRQLSYRLLGHLKEAQRFIGGRMLEGKLLRFCKASADSSKESIALFNIELYVYKKGDRYLILQFKTTAKDSALAECYFKIIADSIH
jgi:hypothetical protein